MGLPNIYRLDKVLLNIVYAPKQPSDAIYYIEPRNIRYRMLYIPVLYYSRDSLPNYLARVSYVARRIIRDIRRR